MRTAFEAFSFERGYFESYEVIYYWIGVPSRISASSICRFPRKSVLHVIVPSVMIPKRLEPVAVTPLAEVGALEAQNVAGTLVVATRLPV